MISIGFFLQGPILKFYIEHEITNFDYFLILNFFVDWNLLNGVAKFADQYHWELAFLFNSLSKLIVVMLKIFKTAVKRVVGKWNHQRWWSLFQLVDFSKFIFNLFFFKYRNFKWFGVSFEESEFPQFTYLGFAGFK